jgi:hypothetical protein
MAGAVGGALGPRHQHQHVDISYLILAGTFYYLLSMQWPGWRHSRCQVNGEIRASINDAKGEIIVERAREQFPQASPRILTDNGPRFITREFKQFIGFPVYALLAILKKQVRLSLRHYKFLSILSVTIFEKPSILEGFSNFTLRAPAGRGLYSIEPFRLLVGER